MLFNIIQQGEVDEIIIVAANGMLLFMVGGMPHIMVFIGGIESFEKRQRALMLEAASSHMGSTSDFFIDWRHCG